MTQKQAQGTLKHERPELRLSAAVTALVDAVEDMTEVRPVLGVVHLEKGKAVVADGYALVQVEDAGILLEGVLDIPLSVLKLHHKKDVTVTTLEDGLEDGAVSVARKTNGVTCKTEAALPATKYPDFLSVVTNALDNTYSACIALDADKIKRLLRFFNSLGETSQTVKLYIPTDPARPILLAASYRSGVNVKALLMPLYVDWSEDSIKKGAAETIKYRKEPK